MRNDGVYRYLWGVLLAGEVDKHSIHIENSTISCNINRRHTNGKFVCVIAIMMTR